MHAFGIACPYSFRNVGSPSKLRFLVIACFRARPTAWHTLTHSSKISYDFGEPILCFSNTNAAMNTIATLVTVCLMSLSARGHLPHCFGLQTTEWAVARRHLPTFSFRWGRWAVLGWSCLVVWSSLAFFYTVTPGPPPVVTWVRHNRLVSLKRTHYRRRGPGTKRELFSGDNLIRGGNFVTSTDSCAQARKKTKIELPF